MCGQCALAVMKVQTKIKSWRVDVSHGKRGTGGNTLASLCSPRAADNPPLSTNCPLRLARIASKTMGGTSPLKMQICFLQEHSKVIYIEN